MAWELGDWMSVLDGAVKVAGLGYSVYGGMQANKTATQQYSNADDYNKAQLALANKNADIAQKQWNLYNEIGVPVERAQALEAIKDVGRNSTIKDYLYSQTMPKLRAFNEIEDSIIGEAQNGVSKQAWMDQGSGDVKQTFSAMRGTADRNNARIGLNPNSERFAAQQKDTGIAEALASAGARTSSARAADDASRNLKYSAMNMKAGYGLLPQTTSNSNGILASSQSAMGQALGGVSGAAKTSAALGGIAAESAAGANQMAGYLGTKMFQPVSQGGVNWESAGNAIKSLFN
jgi:hypothetical protein